MKVAMHGILLLFWLFSFAVPAFHAEINPVSSQAAEQQTLRQVYFQILPATTSMDDLLADPQYHHSFQLLPPEQRLLFSEKEAVWLFTRIQNNGGRTLNMVLDYDFPLADRVEIYQVNREHLDVKLLTRTGNGYPFSERALPYRSFAVNIKLQPNDQTDIYIKVQDAAIIPGKLQLWQAEHFSAVKQHQAMLDGLLQGFLLLLALYNLILLLQTRARHYLYFAGFFVSFALTIAVLNGMAFAILWPGYPEINQAILYIVVGTSLLCLNLFLRYAVLTLPGRGWQLSNQFSSLVALLLLFSPLFAGGQLRLYMLLFAICWVLGSNLLLAIRLSVQGQPQARSFVWACVLILVCAVLLTLSQAGYLPADFNWPYILFSLVLLCLALTSFNLHKLQLKPAASSSTLAELQNYHDIFHNSVEGMFISKLDGSLIRANQALLNILGYQTEEQLTQAISGNGLAHFYANPEQYQYVLQQLELGSRKSFEIHGRRADNSPFWALMSVCIAQPEHERKAFIHGSLTDITEQKLVHEQLAYLANHDALTALYNRYYFEQQLQLLCEQSGVGKGCVLFIDIDKFRQINSQYSHSAADAMLKQLSEVIKQAAHHNGPIARFEVDEFGILLAGKNANEAFSLAYRLIDAVREYRFIWQDSIHNISICIGIAEILPDDNAAEIVMKKAETACAIAKEKGQNRIQLFDSSDQDTQQYQAEINWAIQLRQAIEHDRFVIYQQPLQALTSEANGVQYELLLRMQDEAGNLVPPAGFIPSAERYGVMPQLDRWVIRHYFRWLQQHSDHLQQLTLCHINLSGSSLLDPGFMADVQQMFEHFAIPFERICFEISESVALVNLQSTLTFIEHFRARGCRFALDDFGSGFSSYNYLKQFPADFIKIDGHYVRDLLDDHYDKAIVKSIHDVAKAMGLRSIAKFAENNDILLALKMIGIDYAQGYTIAKPMPLAELIN